MADWAHIDLPAREMVFNQKITFFEQEKPSLQKGTVNDNVGDNPYFASNENIIRETIAVHEQVSQNSNIVLPSVNTHFPLTLHYSQLTVPLNSFVESFQKVDSPRPSSKFDVKESLGVKTGHAFTSETLKGVYNMLGLFK